MARRIWYTATAREAITELLEGARVAALRAQHKLPLARWPALHYNDYIAPHRPVPTHHRLQVRPGRATRPTRRDRVCPSHGLTRR